MPISWISIILFNTTSLNSPRDKIETTSTSVNFLQLSTMQPTLQGRAVLNARQPMRHILVNGNKGV